MNLNNIVGSNWKHIGHGVFRSIALDDGVSRNNLTTNEGTLLGYGTIRNAEIDFSIKIISPQTSIHAAILFRKNGDYYLGAGVGGWSSQFSLMARNKTGIIGFPIGQEYSIQSNKNYDCKVTFESGFITNFECYNEKLIIDNFSIRDSLGSGLSSGKIGLYSWNKTVAEISLSVKKLPIVGFVITNFDSGKEKRRKKLLEILKNNNIDCKLIDADELTQEHPLMVKIKEGIIKSDFIISDFGPEPRPNVYYETGIAHSLGLPTIHIGVDQSQFNEIVPSDLRAQFFILEHEIDKKLPNTVKEILNNNFGIYNYI